MKGSEHAIKMRAFKATDDLETCKKFALGHRQVLESYGIPKVTSSNDSWFFDNGVFVLVVESLSGDEIFGGARIHLANNMRPLPMEDALGKIDEKIYDLVKRFSVGGTGELCGLWLTRETSGKGFSVLLTEASVAEAGIAIVQQLQLGSLFVLCAPWTVAMTKNAGFTIEESVGNNGTFHYPTADLLATLLLLKDIDTLSTADSNQRERIFDLRLNPKQKKMETGPKGKLEIEYDLSLSHR